MIKTFAMMSVNRLNIPDICSFPYVGSALLTSGTKMDVTYLESFNYFAEKL